MLRNLPKKVEDELFEHLKDSYNMGIAVRRKGIRYSAIVLIVMLIVLALVRNVTDGLLVAVAVSVSSLCIVWAIYSISASLNMQADMITRLLVHYAEIQNKTRTIGSDA